MTWIRKYIKRSLFPKFQLTPILRFQIIHDNLGFIALTDSCVELSLVDKTFCENRLHFLLTWLQPNSFGEIFFLEESYIYEKMQKKIKFWKLWEHRLFKIRKYCMPLSKRLKLMDQTYPQITWSTTKTLWFWKQETTSPFQICNVPGHLLTNMHDCEFLTLWTLASLHVGVPHTRTDPR